MDALLAQRGLLGAQRVVVHELAQLLQAGLVRQDLQLDARCTGRGVGIVGNDVEFTDLQRVHADLLRRQVHQGLGHGAGDRVAHAAVLAGGRLVLEHHIEPGPVVLVLVRAAHQVDHLVALDGAGAREHRVRADAGEVDHVEAQDLAGLVDRDARLDLMVAGMDVAGEALQPVGHELHRAAQHDGQGHGGEVVRVGVHLDAEGAAHVLADHADGAGRQVELAAIEVLHHVRGLERVVDRQALLGRVPVRNLGARLQRHAGVAAELEVDLGHRVGLGEHAVHLAHVEAAGEAQVVAQLGVDQRGGRVERGRHLGGRRQFFPVHADEGQRVLGLGAGLGHHGHHRLALPAGTVHRQRVLRCRLHAGQVAQHRHPGLAHLGQVVAVGHQQHAGHGAGLIRMDLLDAHVRHWAAPEGHVGHAGQLDVVDVLAQALGQAFDAAARHGRADVARVVGDGGQRTGLLDARLQVFDVAFHALASWRCCSRCSSTSQMASTMAW